MFLKSDYAVLTSKNDVFIILSDLKVQELIPDLNSINKVNYSNEEIVLQKFPLVVLPVKNKTDNLLLTNSVNKFLSIIDVNGEPVKLLTIEG